jgi:hypothetical protein
MSRISTSIVFALVCTVACKYEFVEGPNEAADEDEEDSEADSSAADGTDTKTTQDEMTSEAGSGTETGSEEVCGNGMVESGEQCDQADFSGRDCTNFGFMAGTLACTDECKVDTTMCE